MPPRKKRFRKYSIFASAEGVGEHCFLDLLEGLYVDSTKVIIQRDPSKGGSPDRIVSTAIREQSRSMSFAWIDEDVPITEETREKLIACWGITDSESFMQCPLKDLQTLHNISFRKPILIVSQPICFESMILRILGKNIPYQSFSEADRSTQVRCLKSILKNIKGNDPYLKFFKQQLTKERIEKARHVVPELDLLIKIISKSI